MAPNTLHSVKQLQHLVEKEIQQLSFHKQPAELYEPIFYILSLGGKRLRPVLLLMAYELFGNELDKALKPALGIEIFHNFTLLHDDIMDNAPLRRNYITVHQKWNTNVAILSGDTMFVKAYELMMQVPDNLLRKVLDLFSKTAIEVCEGQQMDMNFEESPLVPIADYIHMISCKTAVLLAASLKTGALIGGATASDAEHLYDFGKNIGIAFQLQDDVLDVYGDERKFGKQAGGDIAANKKTFLFLKALELSSEEDRFVLHSEFSAKTKNVGEKIEKIKAIYDRLNIKAAAEEEILHFYNKALSCLSIVNVHPEKKTNLEFFVQELIEREL